MLGWLFSITLFIVGLVNKEMDIILAAGLFAIAGTIGFKDFYKK